MKTYDECIAWADSILLLRRNLPSGVTLTSSTQGHAGRFTLKEVDPDAIRQFAIEYNAKISGSLLGEYCSVDVDYPLHKSYRELIADGMSPLDALLRSSKSKSNQLRLRFFYRKQSGRTRREDCEYAF